ncbi:hypothetical protein ACVMGC_007934 [Bradyrhizobium barranii subsp. barranii]|uniref:hypothetical protein n=1 Tax=Bradyrhizobium TaxID=374 RepID=UPI00041B06B4|nr:MULTISPECIES: hypothetical protein [Bradyrhizobium]MBR0877771.1 hypothetical protein [Bradyrhizobium liaoningense]MBR0997736.1 hypothetical protein [Bradyrhizobium liaoningense]MBR1066468.1 hypothetical protein [Bradyrhizobium liaoningense]MCP1743599.1 hypothetical protein [Bradyrhizobium japonicum]MCP1781949.1 hypothetical protein [Bradyrhizobium japonicum]
MIRSPRQRGFVTGLLCGGILVGLVWAASAWLHNRNAAHLPSVDELFSPRGTRAYDQCLVAQRGSTEARDAIMRMRDAYERLQKQ